MDSRIARTLGLAAFLLLALASGGCQVSLGRASSEVPAPQPSLDIGQGDDNLTIEELRAAVTAYAGRFYGAVVPAAGALARAVETAEDRLYASRARFYLIAGAADIATSESPAAALLDMVVFVRLNRLAWQTEGLGHWGEDARPVVDALTMMEREAWTLAARVLDAQQRRELREVIDEWRATHPTGQWVTWVRLSDFGDLGQKTALRQIRGSTGLLGQVQSALGHMDQLRATAERGIYFAKTAQAMIGIQFDMIVRELFAEPEMQSLFGLVASVRVLTETLAEQVQQVGSLPGAFREQTTTLLDSAMARIAEERDKTLALAFEGLARERQILLTDAFAGIAEERETVLGVVLAKMDTLHDEVATEVRTMVREEREATVEDVFRRITEERKSTIEHVQELMGEERGAVFAEMSELVSREREAALSRVEDLGNKAAAHARGLVVLAALLGAGLIVLAAILRAVGRRRQGEPGS